MNCPHCGKQVRNSPGRKEKTFLTLAALVCFVVMTWAYGSMSPQEQKAYMNYATFGLCGN